MKKLIMAIAILMVLISACSFIRFTDEDGFEIFHYASINPEAYVVQSHGGFEIDDMQYTEGIFYAPFVIENLGSEAIEVKITRDCVSEWVTIQENSSLNIEEE